ncbi:MAG TPA: hypothetical protein VJR89_36745 [Polyangiales bacterium]|nr:hypothetical protein [Polyangiales bacterium]
MSEPQSQQQSPALTLTRTLASSGDPQLEQHIFNDLFSAGRQLARISAVVEVLVKALEGNPALQVPDAWSAIEAFAQMQRDIVKAKYESRPEQAIIRELIELECDDPAEHARVATALREYLDDRPA